MPGQALDVTRLEHESLVTEVMRNAYVLRQVEQELRVLREMVERLGSIVQADSRRTNLT